MVVFLLKFFMCFFVFLEFVVKVEDEKLNLEFCVGLIGCVWFDSFYGDRVGGFMNKVIEMWYKFLEIRDILILEDFIVEDVVFYFFVVYML